MVNWFKCHIIFISIGKHWKGVYIHFLPKYCYRIFWAHNKLQWDKH